MLHRPFPISLFLPYTLPYALHPALHAPIGGHSRSLYLSRSLARSLGSSVSVSLVTNIHHHVHHHDHHHPATHVSVCGLCGLLSCYPILARRRPTCRGLTGPVPGDAMWMATTWGTAADASSLFQPTPTGWPAAYCSS